VSYQQRSLLDVEKGEKELQEYSLAQGSETLAHPGRYNSALKLSMGG
jgi:hypothetical protein